MIRFLVSELSGSTQISGAGPWQFTSQDQTKKQWPLWSDSVASDSYAAIQQGSYLAIPDIFQQVHSYGSDHRMQLGVAESCTGGMIGAALTDFPNSSKYFYGGWISYSNHAKFTWLQVSPHDLASEGAVSELVLREMLRGVFENSPCSHGIAVTGIAGPDGGTQKKPVGTVWIGIGAKSGGALIRCFHFLGNRQEVRTAAACASGLMFLEFVWLKDNRIDSLMLL